VSLEYIEYVRKPFKVTAVEVTAANIEELNAEYKIGDMDKKEDGTLCINVTNTYKIPNVSRVFPGYFLTKMGKNVRCFSRKIFFQQFGEMSDEWKAYFEEEKAG
jgi:hypothetical protein